MAAKLGRATGAPTHLEDALPLDAAMAPVARVRAERVRGSLR